MVLYGIWLIDGSSGLLLSHITVPGFTFNPDLFSGFIAASHDFAQETSGGKLSTIAMGNFKLLIRRGRILMKVLAVGARDPETRYDQFFKDIEAKVDPVLAHLHREPNGFKAVTIEFRKQLLEIITTELNCFVTRKAPSDLSELAILQEDEARTLIQALLQRQNAELVPKLATTKIGYSYPLASSITGLDDEAVLQLLEHLADYGLLLAEVTDSSLACPQCDSLHLHPHILCPTCQTPAHPVELFEHLPCGTISVKLDNETELYCNRCGARNGDNSEFRVFRGYQCQKCNSFFKKPQMVFTCHSCHTITEPENARVRVLKKYVLNPALISDLELLLTKPKKPSMFQASPTEAMKEFPPLESSMSVTTEMVPNPLNQSNTEESLGPTASHPLLTNATESVHSSSEPLKNIVTGDEARLLQELKSLESALRSGTITEAEYDRKFVRLKLQLRRIRSQETL